MADIWRYNNNFSDKSILFSKKTTTEKQKSYIVKINDTRDVTGIQNKSAFEDRMEKLNALDSCIGVIRKRMTEKQKKTPPPV